MDKLKDVGKALGFGLLFLLIVPTNSNSQTIYYIDADSGNDSYSGTQSQPFKTIDKGVSTLGSNIGTLYLREGTYATASKISLTKSGQANDYIKIWAYENEKVIIDFSSNASTSDDGFSISGSYYYLKGLDIRYAPHNGIKISGNNNIIENCITRNCSNTGLHITGGSSDNATTPSNNLILNCDSFYNFDSPIGGNADGFSAKWSVGSGNEFRGCRAWNNSDDGWDLWMCTGSILIDSCYAFRNGIDIWYTGEFDGNGNGIKLGGNNVATPHIVKNCIAFDNAGNGGKGFDENNNLAGQTLYNCTAFRNQSYNFALYNDPLTSGTHTVKNCISYLPGSTDILKNTVQEANSWLGFTVSNSDFESIDTAGVTAERNANGRIPTSSFLRLASNSQFINAGVDIGTPYAGSAPDLGAFEYGYTPTAIEDNILTSNYIVYNFPNPFSNETTIKWDFTTQDIIRVDIFNITGQLIESEYCKDTNQLSLNTTTWASGIYSYRILTGKTIHTGKMVKH
ncbi:MAG: T9SS type A sorting domain-containing protein [Bacteroidales bacterium]